MAYNSCKIFKTEFVLLGIGNFQIRVRALNFALEAPNNLTSLDTVWKHCNNSILGLWRAVLPCITAKQQDRTVTGSSSMGRCFWREGMHGENSEWSSPEVMEIASSVDFQNLERQVTKQQVAALGLEGRLGDLQKVPLSSI